MYVLDAVTVFQMVKNDCEDDTHVFRKAANDITSQLEINFGNLPRPGRGARGGTRGGRGRIRRAENYGPRAEVVVGICILNPGWFSEEPQDEDILALPSLISEGHPFLSCGSVWNRDVNIMGIRWVQPLCSPGLQGLQEAHCLP